MSAPLKLPPWEYISQWREAQALIYVILHEAKLVREGAIAALQDPADGPMNWGSTFYMRWIARLRELSARIEQLEIVNEKRGVFAISGVAVRMYRAEAERQPPSRVLKVCKEEAFFQTTMFAALGLYEDIGQEGADAPDLRYRIRTITHDDGLIAEFVFEELDRDGVAVWAWSIKQEEVPPVLTVPDAPESQPIKQDPPAVKPRLVLVKKADDEE